MMAICEQNLFWWRDKISDQITSGPFVDPCLLNDNCGLSVKSAVKEAPARAKVSLASRGRAPREMLASKKCPFMSVPSVKAENERYPRKIL